MRAARPSPRATTRGASSRTPYVVVLLLLLLPAALAARPGAHPCDLLSPPDLTHPLSKAAPFARAVARLRDGDFRGAARAWTRALAALTRDAERAFRPRRDGTADVERARAFLDRHVYAPDASLVVADEGFLPVPDLLAAGLRAYCFAGDLPRATALARRAARAWPEDAAKAIEQAWLELSAGRPEAAARALPAAAPPADAARYHTVAAYLAARAGDGDALSRHVQAAREAGPTPLVGLLLDSLCEPNPD